MKIEIEIPENSVKFIQSLFGTDYINVIEKKVTDDINYMIQNAKSTFV